LIAYKIVETYDNGLRSLFHGTDGTRHFSVGVWLDAQIRLNAKDGTSKTTYRSGYHVLLTLKECEDYLSKFKKRLNNLVIVKVEIGDEIWAKTHSPSNVILASKMKIIEVVSK
jgi:hypothetical protein